MTARIAVYGAYGHTGRFVLDELRQRGLMPVACGRDIYAITAPLLVEALQRILTGRVHGSGAFAPGQAFDPLEFLAALVPRALTLTFGAV